MSEKQTDTVRPTSDMYGLGRSGGQRGAEILAGMRAIETPSALNNALSGMMGRVVARTLITMVRNRGGLNYVFARTAAIDQSVEAALGNTVEGKLVVETASGLAARGLNLARKYATLDVIEIDQTDVIAEKQQRLRNAKIDTPANLTFLSVDLGTTKLSDVLNNRRADLIVSEGLTMYLDENELAFAMRSIFSSLKPGGYYITDVNYTAGVQAIMQQGGRLFSRQAGQFKTAYDTKEQFTQFMQSVGFGTVTYRHPAQVAQEQGLPQPIIESGWIITARRSMETSNAE